MTKNRSSSNPGGNNLASKPDADSNPGPAPEPKSKTSPARKLILLAVFVISFGVLFWLSRQYLNLDYLSGIETTLKEYQQQHPLIVYSVAFAIYVLVTGFSIPGATVMTLVYAWFFGFWRSLLLISFASTAGATMAFLIARYLVRDWIQNKFGERLETFNEALDKDGPFYLFTLRLIPAVPFFVLNAVMGLTRIKVTTFWWVSQIGMLAGTAMYTYAGSRIPDLQTLQSDGIESVFSSSQIIQLTIAFALLGLFPLVVKKLFGRKIEDSAESAVDPHS